MSERRYEKPWGYYYNIEEENGYLIKKLVVRPDSRLSLQKHKYRSENWIVLKGKAKIMVEQEVEELKKGDHVFIDKNTKHRLSNPYDEILEVLEVQTGTVLSEEDIERFEDDYDRI